jgi:AhpC/TSA antioxidant enzyme
MLPVIGEDLQSLQFGSLFIDHLTVVCFIRHFYCPLCSDYMISLVATANPDALRDANIDLVIISDGSPKMIAAYRKIFKCPFPIYTDPTRNLYRALGMTLRTLDAGPAEEAGDYITHGPLGWMRMVLKNAVRMPLANAGDIKQLGGEFLLGPGPVCHYAHRMHTTKSHVPVRELLERAGVDMNPIPREIRHFVDTREEERWMRERERKIKEIRDARLARRGYLNWIDECTCLDSTRESFCD